MKFVYNASSVGNTTVITAIYQSQYTYNIMTFISETIADKHWY